VAVVRDNELVPDLIADGLASAAPAQRSGGHGASLRGSDQAGTRTSAGPGCRPALDSVDEPPLEHQRETAWHCHSMTVLASLDFRELVLRQPAFTADHDSCD